jgi:hypothetical protein
MKTAFGISTYHRHRLPFLHSTAWAWCKEATCTRPTALRSSFVWMQRLLGSSNALHRTSSTQSSRPVTSLNWSSASLVTRSKGRLHSYPSDCSKYIVCREGCSEIELQDCPKPLLFDPVLLRCNIPELVYCSTAV